MAKVKICETGLRDAHQSLIATRMTTEEMLPILKTMDEVGYVFFGGMGRRHFRCLFAFSE